MNDGTEDMLRCTEIRLELLDLLQERLSPEGRASVEGHVSACASCAEELSSLREVWNALPEPAKAIPPVAIRAKALAYARGEVEQTEPVLSGLWQAVRGVAVPGALGAAAAAIIVLLLHLRGAMAPLDQPTVAALSLALAATLVAVAGGLWRSVTPRRVRAVLLGSVGALGGYLVLTVISPIPDTVQICRVALFRNVPMSLGEVCLVYLVVAGLYAGVPMALAAYAEGGAGNPWRMGSAEAAIFALLVAPTVVLQLGVEEAMFTLTVVLGVVAGSLAGGVSGAWIRSRRILGATAGA